MRSARLAAVVLATTGLTLACSSSTSPSPTFTGTWHVTVGTMNSGNITPSPFTVAVTQVSANSLLVSMPALTWSIGPIVYDSASEGTYPSGGTVVEFDEMHRSPRNACDAILVYGNTNAARDTIMNAKIAILDTGTVNLQPGVCVSKDSATAVVVKQ